MVPPRGLEPRAYGLRIRASYLATPDITTYYVSINILIDLIMDRVVFLSKIQAQNARQVKITSSLPIHLRRIDGSHRKRVFDREGLFPWLSSLSLSDHDHKDES